MKAEAARQERQHAVEVASAHDAGLRYAHDTEPGVTRRRTGSGFVYRDATGRPVDRATRDRIRALVIPPAWRDVWIARDPRAHLQVTGRDARGRKQYRYHPRWSKVRDAAKYDRLRAFGRALPAIRRRISADLGARPLSRPWLLATVARILEHSVIRIGNDEYRRANGSYGLTTLRNRHAEVHGDRLTLRFRAKSGVQQVVELTDGRLARRVRKCQELPGQTLFQYIDERARVRAIGSSDVNAYLRDAAGSEFTAKDFRTWTGTLAAARALDSARRQGIVGRPRASVTSSARWTKSPAKLGNTRAVCRKCYVHPIVIEHYLGGRTLSGARGGAALRGLDADERALLVLLEASPAGSRRVVSTPATANLRRSTPPAGPLRRSA